MDSKRQILVTNETPNDKGSIIRTATIDTSRFDKNPVMLYAHGEDPELGKTPIGHWEDRKIIGTDVFYTPVFSDSKHPKIVLLKTLYDEGNLKAASIGGAVIYKTDFMNNPVKNADGLLESEYFLQYEISIVPMPSNPDAVEQAYFSAKCYEANELDIKKEEVLQLKSNFIMEKGTVEVKSDEQKNLEVKPKVELLESDYEKVGQFAAGLKDPGLIGKFFKAIFGSSEEQAPKDEATKAYKETKIPETKENQPEKGVVTEAEYKARELEAEAATLESEGAKMSKKAAGKRAEAEFAKAKLKSLEAEKLEKESEEEKDEELKKEKLNKAKLCKAEATKLEEGAKKLKADSDGDEDGDGVGDQKTIKEKARLKTEKEKKEELESLYNNLPPVIKKALVDGGVKDSVKLKTEQEMLELSAEGKLAPKPAAKVVVRDFNKTYTELASDSEGKKIISRVKNSFGTILRPDDHLLLLKSMINDPAYKNILGKMRFNADTKFANYSNANVHELAQMAANSTNVYDFKSGKMIQNLALSGASDGGTTDSALANPQNLAIEWMNLVFFTLYPSDDWRAEIAVLPAQITEKNRGIVYTNIKADPNVYEGSMPSSPADYDQSTADTAVSMSLKPFWLQPMIWTPELMAQVRYDMMGSGWTQGLHKFRTAISNYLIYELAALIPTSNYIATTGASFKIAGSTDPNSFKLNPAFSNASALSKALITDAAKFEQLFERQNFELPEGASIIAPLDPTMRLQIKLDPDTKSLLTRFVVSNGSELEGYGKVGFRGRSQLALYDPAGGHVIDPTGVIPATSVSAAPFFVPSQVLIGLANLDVFMQQKPSAYGIEMSCNTRQGIALARDNGDGAGLYYFGAVANQ